MAIAASDGLEIVAITDSLFSKSASSTTEREKLAVEAPTAIDTVVGSAA